MTCPPKTDPEAKAELLKEVYEKLELEIPEDEFLEECIDILTMHGAKGLDSKIVFIPGLEKEIIPGPKRMEYPGLILEAARMLYVSITRAESVCILSFSDNRIYHGSYKEMTPSIFNSHLGQQFDYRDRYDYGFSSSEISLIKKTINNL